MPRTMDSPQNVMNGVDFFKSKLQFEATPHQLKELMDQKLPTLLVVDVRDKASYDKEHIPGAINIPLQELLGRLRDIPKEKTVVCYCWTYSCALATKACLDLAHKDYKVQELFGGIRAWKEAGFDCEGADVRKPNEAQY